MYEDETNPKDELLEWLRAHGRKISEDVGGEGYFTTNDGGLPEWGGRVFYRAGYKEGAKAALVKVAEVFASLGREYRWGKKKAGYPYLVVPHPFTLPYVEVEADAPTEPSDEAETAESEAQAMA